MILSSIGCFTALSKSMTGLAEYAIMFVLHGGDSMLYKWLALAMVASK